MLSTLWTEGLWHVARYDTEDERWMPMPGPGPGPVSRDIKPG